MREPSVFVSKFLLKEEGTDLRLVLFKTTKMEGGGNSGPTLPGWASTMVIIVTEFSVIRRSLHNTLGKAPRRRHTILFIHAKPGTG